MPEYKWSESLGAFYGITEDEYREFARIDKLTLGEISREEYDWLSALTKRMLDYAQAQLETED